MIIRYTVYILHYIKYLHGGCLSTGRWYRRHYTHTSLWRRVPFYTIHQELHAPLLTDYHRLIFMTATTWAMVDWRQPQIMWVVILVTVFIRRHLHWIILWLWLMIYVNLYLSAYSHRVSDSISVWWQKFSWASSGIYQKYVVLGDNHRQTLCFVIMTYNSFHHSFGDLLH